MKYTLFIVISTLICAFGCTTLNITKLDSSIIKVDDAIRQLEHIIEIFPETETAVKNVITTLREAKLDLKCLREQLLQTELDPRVITQVVSIIDSFIKSKEK